MQSIQLQGNKKTLPCVNKIKNNLNIRSQFLTELLE